MSWVDDTARYEAIARKVEPAVWLTAKDSWIWKVIGALVHVFTFGGTTYRKFLDDYGTTIGPVVASPRAWSTLSEGYLVHEATHARDMRLAGLSLHPWVGLLPYGIAYLLLFFPIGLAWCRYRLELRADRARWRYELAHGFKSPEDIQKQAERRGEKLRGGAYGYAWPGARGGYRRTVEAVIKEFLR